ncbi:MAG: glycosyl transferase, group 1 [Candidatus Brocadiaceae bacterium]|nr:glycosyl transferase, group 1 [Candidatus Brocadiaceae bacterium]
MPNLLVCMTPGTGLNVWKNIGSLNRELKPYVEYARRGWKVKILTFDKGDIPELPEGIESVRFPHHPRLLWLLPWTHKALGKWADVIKTNQSKDAHFYTMAARLWRKPILLRCGYVQGEYLETTTGLTPNVRFYQWLEAKAFRLATHCQVPTKELSEWVQKKYRIGKDKISVIPNFVDSELFKPLKNVHKKETSVISVGRLAPVKQFDLLIRACAEIPSCTLTIVGEGPERKNLEGLAAELKVNLYLPGNLPNEKLPKILQEHQIFAITSMREGHPKSLIEAMACGMPCVAIKAIGTESLIKHGVNGLLVGPTVNDVKDGLSLLVSDETLQRGLSQRSAQFAISEFSFEKLIVKEFAILSSLAHKAPGKWKNTKI